MNESFEYKGYWYISSNPNNKIAGILNYQPNNSIRLELFDSFSKSENPIINFLERETIDIIWGITSDAKKISLINCFPSQGKQNLGCEFSLSFYNIQYCLVGIHIDNIDDKRFKSSKILMPLLTTWCYPGAIKKSIQFNKKNVGIKKINVSIDYEENDKPITSVILNDNTILEIKKNVDYNESHYSEKKILEQYTYFKINKKNEVSFKDFIHDIFEFENFISLATLTTVKASNIILIDESQYQMIKSNKIFHPIKLYYKSEEKINNNTSKNDYFLFNYSQINTDFPRIIQKWYSDNFNIIPIKKHLIKSISFTNTFDSLDFLIIVQALEGFHTRFRIQKQMILRQRLQSLIKEFNNIQFINKLKIDIQVVVDSRNYYSHFMNKSEKPKTLDGYELYLITKELRILLICCILNYCGFENEKIEQFLLDSNNRGILNK
ncbi:HEPN domain-containing protein [Chishuiella sp.]|uniref:ApeA N-terminal domain 1-containing protein n=1 Tax=Chishuiella sp. TaxID=1969467 RepID=UPI0028ABC45E|nr:HEPN domain-containing protein [Chishuiella sp.]